MQMGTRRLPHTNGIMKVSYTNQRITKVVEQLNKHALRDEQPTCKYAHCMCRTAIYANLIINL